VPGQHGAVVPEPGQQLVQPRGGVRLRLQRSAAGRAQPWLTRRVDGENAIAAGQLTGETIERKKLTNPSYPDMELFGLVMTFWEK
jgi:hypothetical protein